MTKLTQPTTAEMRERHDADDIKIIGELSPLEMRMSLKQAHKHRGILLDRLEAADNEASTLALSLWRRHYKKDSPVFELCDSVAGIISQIDNMSAGISNSLEAAESKVNHLRKVRAMHFGLKLKAEAKLEAANAEIREFQEALDEQAKELEMANRVVAEAGRKEYKYQAGNP